MIQRGTVMGWLIGNSHFGSYETAILAILEVLNLIFGENSASKSDQNTPKFHFVTLRFYVQSNLAMLGGQNVQF